MSCDGLVPIDFWFDSTGGTIVSMVDERHSGPELVSQALQGFCESKHATPVASTPLVEGELDQ